MSTPAETPDDLSLVYVGEPDAGRLEFGEICDSWAEAMASKKHWVPLIERAHPDGTWAIGPVVRTGPVARLEQKDSEWSWYGLLTVPLDSTPDETGDPGKYVTVSWTHQGQHQQVLLDPDWPMVLCLRQMDDAERVRWDQAAAKALVQIRAEMGWAL